MKKLLLYLVGLPACISRAPLPSPSISTVTPANVVSNRLVELTIGGTNFFSALDGPPDNIPNKFLDRWQVHVGGLALTSIALLDLQSLKATLPSTLAPGTHDLTITTPDGAQATKTRALRVLPVGDDCAPFPLPLTQRTDVGPSDAASIEALIAEAADFDTLVFSPGIYNVPNGGWRIERDNIALLADKSGGLVQLVATDSRSDIVTIAASNVMLSGFTFSGGREAIRVLGAADRSIANTVLHDLQIRDTKNSMIRIGRSSEGTFADSGIISCSTFELTDSWRTSLGAECGISGIAAGRTRDWLVIGNTFRGFWCAADPDVAVRFRRGCRDIRIEGNLFFNNTQAISFGVLETNPAIGGARLYEDSPCAPHFVDHTGGHICGNFIFSANAVQPQIDAGIALWNACQTVVAHNALVSLATPTSSIEWRWLVPENAVVIENNLVSHDLRERTSQPPGILVGNLSDIGDMTTYLKDSANGDLHLNATSPAIAQAVSPSFNACPYDFDGDLFSEPADVGADQR